MYRAPHSLLIYGHHIVEQTAHCNIHALPHPHQTEVSGSRQHHMSTITLAAEWRVTLLRALWICSITLGSNINPHDPTLLRRRQPPSVENKVFSQPPPRLQLHGRDGCTPDQGHTQPRPFITRPLRSTGRNTLPTTGARHTTAPVFIEAPPL